MKSVSDSDIDLEMIDAVIFDMDGVVTDTATVHAMAWKQLFDEYLKKRAEKHGEKFKPFDADSDYRRYVDGKPRYDGVRSFLESRGISLPTGSPDDNPGEETIYGLGKRKNGYFLDRLERDGVTVYQSTVDFINGLRDEGVHTAVISSSRNCEEVLRAAGVRELFEVKVDGVDSAELGIKGKPDPDIFLEAARRLSVEPGRAVIVEDALAGVQAGRKGGFGLVIGVDRTGHGDELVKQGADIVVRDLSELKLLHADKAGKVNGAGRIMKDVPSALEKREAIFRYFEAGTPAVFLDYDGTLTPIVAHPAQAVLSDDMRSVLERLKRKFKVVILSGRDLADVQDMVGIEGIVYAGSHGFDVAGPGGYHDDEKGREFLAALDKAERELQNSLKGIPGARVERKRFAIAVHFRQVDSADVGALEKEFDRVLSGHPQLRKSAGKKIFELVPDIDWNKGRALLSLVEKLYEDSEKVVPLYIGDDTTDEDAFRAIRDRGIGIVVGDEERKTAACYRLQDTDEVRAFLEALLEMAKRGEQ